MEQKSREVAFQRRLMRLAAATRTDLDDLTVEVYTEALCHQVEPEEWEQFTRLAVERGVFAFFPKVRELLDSLAEFRGAPKLDAEAVVAYDRVMASGTYQPEGTHWSFRAIADTCGKAAAEAFLEAGGDSAFGVTDQDKGGYRDAERRKKFIAAYTLAARQEPGARLLPAGQKLLTGEAREISRGEAAELLAKIAGIAS